MRTLLVLLLVISGKSWAQVEPANTSPNLRMSGDVALLSHYIENGLSQSDYSPALQGSFWFNFGPQFRLGLWGSNTNYKDSGDTFNLRLGADVNVNLSPESFLKIGYLKNTFYNKGDRNGEIFSMAVHARHLRLLFQRTANWENTSQRADRYGFGISSNVFNNWKWNNEFGYTNTKADNLNAFFDFKTGLGTRWGAMFFEGALTGTSESSQFDGRGDVFFILSASTEF